MIIQTISDAYFSCDVAFKCEATARAFELLTHSNGAFTYTEPLTLALPGRPEKPALVSPRDLKKRGLGTEQGRAALWHAIAHIEFNAINLALDAFLRFPGLPHDYYADWLRVANEEAYHFSLINAHLSQLGYPYGSFPAHNSLWELAEKTTHDPLVRMALVPRVMEARGLDVTPSIMQKLSLAGDEQAEKILSIILRDEIGHVAVGNCWFKYLCHERGLPPLDTFEKLAAQYLHSQLKGPYERALRAQAGFDSADLDWLELHYP